MTRTLSRSLLTGLVAWASVVIPAVLWSQLSNAVLWQLSYILPQWTLLPFLSLSAFMWVAAAAGLIVLIWQHR